MDVAGGTAPSNQTLSTATTITALPYYDGADTTSVTDAPGDPTPTCRTTVNGSLWYRFTPTTTGVYHLSTDGSTRTNSTTSLDTVLAVWTGTPGSLTEIACDDSSGTGSTSFIRTALQAGVTYTIMAAGDGSLSGDLRFSLIDVSANVAPNDDFNNATAITALPFSVDQSNRDYVPAADDPASSCSFYGGNTGSMWFRYTATQRQLLDLSLYGSNFDVVLSVWTGTRGNLTEAGCNNGSGNTAQVFLETVPGTTYHIMIGGHNNASGDVRFRASDATGLIAPNATINSATVINDLTFSDYANTRYSFADATDPAASCSFYGGNANSVWYEYTPAADTDVFMSTNGSNFNTTLSV